MSTGVLEREQSLVSSDQLDGLRQVRRPACAAAIWQRELGRSFRDWIDGHAPSALPSARFVVDAHDVEAAIDRTIAASGLTPGAHRDWLRDDACALATTFRRLMDTPFLRVRFDVIASNACAKFHIDAVTARLICTYRGHGTEYGFAPTGPKQSAPDKIMRLPAGAPMVLRGTLWLTTPPASFVHRSPPIEGTGETRLLLVLDPITDPNEV